MELKKFLFFSNNYVSMWFLGIIFRRVENAESVNIDLTYDIQSFTDTGKTLSSWSCGSQVWL